MPSHIAGLSPAFPGACRWSRPGCGSRNAEASEERLQFIRPGNRDGERPYWQPEGSLRTRGGSCPSTMTKSGQETQFRHVPSIPFGDLWPQRDGQVHLGQEPGQHSGDCRKGLAGCIGSCFCTLAFRPAFSSPQIPCRANCGGVGIACRADLPCTSLDWLSSRCFHELKNMKVSLFPFRVASSV